MRKPRSLKSKPATPEDDAEALGRAASDADERGDYQRAIELFKKASRIGKSDSWHLNLGTLYDDKLVPPSPKRAVYYWKLAAKTHPAAAYNLAVHYFWQGNERWRLFWLNRAIELGDKDAVQDFEEWKATRFAKGTSMSPSNLPKKKKKAVRR